MRLNQLGVALIAVASLTSCTSNGTGWYHVNKVTIGQARQQLDDYVKESVAALPAAARLGPLIGDSGPIPCDDSDGALSTSPARAQADNWITGLPSSGNAEYLDAFVAHWITKGWRIVDDPRPHLNYVAVANSVGYSLVLATTLDGLRLSIGGSSACASREPPETPSGSL